MSEQPTTAVQPDDVDAPEIAARAAAFVADAQARGVDHDQLADEWFHDKALATAPPELFMATLETYPVEVESVPAQVAELPVLPEPTVEVPPHGEKVEPALAVLAKLDRGLARRSDDRPSDDRDDFHGLNTDSVHAYLREIGRVSLLTGPQELSLARRIKFGIEAAERIAAAELRGERSSDDRLSDDEFLMADGLAAKQDLIQANLRLVVSIAKRYRNRGMPFLDLIQEGNVGLMKAVDKFDYERGFKFSTYATWWIRQAITRSIADQARTIRVPVHLVETINKVVRTQRGMLQELGREPTVDEVAERVELSAEKVRELLKLEHDTVSLETPVGDENDYVLSDTLQDATAVTPPELADRKMLNEAVRKAIEDLNDREQLVVRMRFGLDDGEMRTLEEVGKEFGVTRERIRQIESKTLAKLRNPIRSHALRDYFDED